MLHHEGTTAERIALATSFLILILLLIDWNNYLRIFQGILFNDCCCVICRCVVVNDYFVLKISLLRQKAIESVSQVFFVVICYTILQ